MLQAFSRCRKTLLRMIRKLSKKFQKLSKNKNGKDKTMEVVKDVGYPILLDAGSNMGFGALIFSVFLPVQYIGGLMVFAMISTSLGTLVLLASGTQILSDRFYKL